MPTDGVVENGGIAERRDLASQFRLREIHPNLHLGTASDRYGGWVGQIYPEIYRSSIEFRPTRAKGEKVIEQIIPVESVRHYFERFDVLEIDFTFYRPLRDNKGDEQSTLKLLREYAEHAPEDALFLLKAPQTFFARKLRRSKEGSVSYVDNPDFLNAGACLKQFLEPAVETLQGRLLGVIFEQGYQRAQEAPAPEQNLAELDSFFGNLPQEMPYHIELRTESLLVQPYFDWLEARGFGFVFSFWTWLPSIREQWKRCEGRFTAADGNAVVRLMSTPAMKYDDAFLLTHPFDKPVPELVNAKATRDMILDVTALVYRAEEQDVTINAIASNHAYGNAPALCQAIAYRVLEEEERRG
jgi:uncharacterized protein YecE (DUF72 family)